MKLKKIESGSYETEDRQFFIQVIYDASFRKDRWMVYSQIPEEKFWQAPERAYLNNFDTLREAREWLEKRIESREWLASLGIDVAQETGMVGWRRSKEVSDVREYVQDRWSEPRRALLSAAAPAGSGSSGALRCGDRSRRGAALCSL